MIDRTNRYYLTTAEMLVMRAIWLADHDMVLSEDGKYLPESSGSERVLTNGS